MADSGKKPSEAAAQHTVAANDDSDPDFDDLDDVLDQFSANAPSASQAKAPATQPPSSSTPATSGPGRPATSTAIPAAPNEPVVPSGQRVDESESEFLERLSKEMSSMLNSLAADPSKSAQSPEEMAKMGRELEEFTAKMEQEGIQPEDLLKALLGEEEGSKIAEMAHMEREKVDKAEQQPASSSSISASSEPKAGQKSTTSAPSAAAAASSSSASTQKPTPKSFEDTIRSTMSRLGESDKSATTAVQKESTKKSEEDMLADMLRALDSGGAGSSGDDSGLSKMFIDMMQQLTHKDLLYEPMKELNDQYPSWLAANRAKLPATEYERYSRQSAIVADITRKFEEPSFSDDDPKCREFVWERMQRMQDEGAPPEELVKNPFPGTDFGGIPGLGGGGGDGAGEQIPEGLAKELEEGCPTQ